MILRLAKPSDVKTCGTLDGSYTTEHSWQIAEERRPGRGADELTLNLRTVLLPRPRSVLPPDPTPELEAEWDRTDLFLIAEEDSVIAYLCATVTRGGGWINRLTVDKPYRRRGVGSSLIAAAEAWAREHRLGCVLAAAPTKNYPAISLLKARGYKICGYNERHFSNGDIALYLAHDIPNE